jgi:hypothetical protein
MLNLPLLAADPAKYLRTSTLTRKETAMDFNKIELDALKEAGDNVTTMPVELTDLQLALVGGGSGEVSPY